MIFRKTMCTIEPGNSEKRRKIRSYCLAFFSVVASGSNPSTLIFAAKIILALNKTEQLFVYFKSLLLIINTRLIMKAINICVTLVCILFFSTSLEAQKNGKQIREEVIAKSQHSIKQRPQEEQKNRFNPAKKEVRHLNNSPIKAPQLPQAVMR